MLEVALAFVAKQGGAVKLIKVVRESLKDQKSQHERGEPEDE